MNSTTPWYASKGVWGSVVAVAAGFSGLLHIDMTAAIQDQISEILVDGGAMVGGLIALYGRIKAVAQVVWK